MRVFVGLGEGIGNVVMGLPVVDSLLAEGHLVDLDLRPTPPSVWPELAALVSRGRPMLQVVGGGAAWADRYDAACLTWWWLSRGGPNPVAAMTFHGPAVREDVPEIVQNLDTVAELVTAPGQRAMLFGVAPASLSNPEDSPLVVLHPGCKPEWRERKMYPRWAEVVTHLKRLGARVAVVGSKADEDIFCGEPQIDDRGADFTLAVTATTLAAANVVLSGDSGLHHMAVALGVPTVAIFGQSSHVKAAHPDPVVRPVILGPFPDPAAFARVHPRVIARAALRAASATVGA